MTECSDFPASLQAEITMGLDRDVALGECLSLLTVVVDHETCLRLYPHYAAELDPLLTVAAEMWRVRTPPPRLVSYWTGQDRMLAALACCHPFWHS